jgi:nucleoside-diphosphate-sugar epimerase
MRILFTGHKGTLGRELIPYLRENHDVQCYDINYSSIENVNQFFRNREFDFVIHSAIRGGRRVRQDSAEDLYNNLMMFECLASQSIPMINFCSGASYGRKKDIDNVEEKDFGKLIPDDYYGLSKYLITYRSRQMRHVYNLRFFNVFGPESPKDMFTTVNIKNYINKREIVIFKDRLMDLFGIDDTKKVVDLYLSGDINLPRELNLVYSKSYYLSEVAEMINNLSDYKVPIDIFEPGYEKSYSASGYELSKLNLELDGLNTSIKKCYLHYLNHAK